MDTQQTACAMTSGLFRLTARMQNSPIVGALEAKLLWSKSANATRHHNPQSKNSGFDLKAANGSPCKSSSHARLVPHMGHETKRYLENGQMAAGKTPTWESNAPMTTPNANPK